MRNVYVIRDIEHSGYDRVIDALPTSYFLQKIKHFAFRPDMKYFWFLINKPM